MAAQIHQRTGGTKMIIIDVVLVPQKLVFSYCCFLFLFLLTLILCAWVNLVFQEASPDLVTKCTDKKIWFANLPVSQRSFFKCSCFLHFCMSVFSLLFVFAFCFFLFWTIAWSLHYLKYLPSTIKESPLRWFQKPYSTKD